jgi:hypothetical protein
MSSLNIATSLLKGCDAKFINDVATSSLNGKDVLIQIHNKAVRVVNEYDINECIKVITKYGDFHDAYLKMTSSPEIQSNISSNKLKFHRQVAFIYVKQVIETKFKVKIDAIKLKRKISSGSCDMTCSICLENIDNDAQFTTCNHAFHRTCMTKWGRKICPMCRSDI